MMFKKVPKGFNSYSKVKREKNCKFKKHLKNEEQDDERLRDFISSFFLSLIFKEILSCIKCVYTLKEIFS